MTSDEFQTQMTRLSETFGKNAYGHERVKLIWRMVSDLDSGWMLRTVDSFISSMRQAPLVGDFNDAVLMERDRQWSYQKKQAVGNPWDKVDYACEHCRDNGVYLCTNPGMGGFWAFRCHCMRGRQDPRAQIPHFKDAHRADGFVRFDGRRA